MIFKLHYVFLTSGACAITILLGVFMEFYTDASSVEIGALLMMMPFTNMIFRPLICSKADRMQAHQKCIIICLLVTVISYSPFIIIPILGPSVYEEHPRICFYLLVVMKIIGDIGFGGVSSIGDALAINYAERIGAEFGDYRIYGSLSWMGFGLLIGQINEVYFLPKYVPGFMVLLVSSLANAFIIWLWPPEYFVMVARRDRKHLNSSGTFEQNAKPKCLMPKEVVLAHMKSRLLSVFKQSHNGTSRTTTGSSIFEKPTMQSIELNQQVETQEKPRAIKASTQIKALALLLRRDLRIILYLLYFIVAGSGVAPISFFIIALSNICHQEGTCDFSQLVGMVQVTMAFMETVLFCRIKGIEEKIGRLNLCTVGLLFLALKYLFYSTIWFSINPYWCLLAEATHGVSFGVFIAMMVEMGHLFANEVELILPELQASGIVTEGEESERLKLSLAATMQALVSSANDGVGRGFGALAYGFIMKQYSFHTLMDVVSIYLTCSLAIMVLIVLYNAFFKPKLGFDRNKSEKQIQPKLRINIGGRAEKQTEFPETKQSLDLKEIELA